MICCKFICRFRKTGILHDAPPSGQKLKLSDEQITFIDQKTRGNDELTAAEIKQKLSEEFGVAVSVATIKRVRRENLGWRSKRARYCQFAREPNKMKRLIFCLILFLCRFSLMYRGLYLRYWSGLTVETCQNYIQHIHKVVPAVFANEGGQTKY